MSVSFILSNSHAADSNINNSVNLSFAGVGTWLAATFFAYENQTINRVMFYNQTVTNPANFVSRVGMGTIDRNIGLPATVSGLGQSIFFSSSIDVTNLSTGWSIHAIPDFSIEAQKKYFIGIQAVSNSGAFLHAVGVSNLNNPVDRPTTSPILSRTTGNPTFLQYDGNRHISFNWGYDSGNGITSWYNPNNGPATYNTIGSVNLTNLVGFTFCHNTDFESIYVESIRIFGRIAESNFATGGFGTTLHCILYDSDGTTALIGQTFNYYTSTTIQVANIHCPLGYWLDKNKLYHIAFAYVNGTTQANNQLVYSLLPYEWQSSTGYTSIYFTKTSGSSAPSYTNTRVIPFQLHIAGTRGHLQNNIGDYNVF